MCWSYDAKCHLNWAIQYCFRRLYVWTGWLLLWVHHGSFQSWFLCNDFIWFSRWQVLWGMFCKYDHVREKVSCKTYYDRIVQRISVCMTEAGRRQPLGMSSKNLYCRIWSRSKAADKGRSQNNTWRDTWGTGHFIRKCEQLFSWLSQHLKKLPPLGGSLTTWLKSWREVGLKCAHTCWGNSTERQSSHLWDIVTGDKMRIFRYDPPKKAATGCLRLFRWSSPVKFKWSKSFAKQMVACFFSKSGHAATITLDDRETINSNC